MSVRIASYAGRIVEYDATMSAVPQIRGTASSYDDGYACVP